MMPPTLPAVVERLTMVFKKKGMDRVRAILATKGVAFSSQLKVEDYANIMRQCEKELASPSRGTADKKGAK